MFHLPHNAVIPEEVKFIISCIDETKEYYLYEELKALVFNLEIQKKVFSLYHKGMYANYMNTPVLKDLYEKVQTGKLSYEDIKNKPYTDKKTINGVWNEIVRDYFEFFAFTGLMPSYYKGKSQDSEKRYYIGETLKQYKSGAIDYQEILFRMKHRNASKDFSSFTQQYDIRNRPFVVALKLLDIFKKKGYSQIDGNTVSYYVKKIKDEDKINEIDLKPIDKSDFSETELKEIGRGTTFLRQHLIRGLNVVDLATSKNQPCIFDLTKFEIDNYKFNKKAVFIGDVFETSSNNIELTPYILKCISNPSEIDDVNLKNELKELGLIDDTKSLCDFNIDTDLLSRELVNSFLRESLTGQENLPVYQRVETTPEYKEGKIISQNSDGTAYEKFLWEQLKVKFGEDCVHWFGSKTTGQRLSDITCDVEVVDADADLTKLKIIVESKAGSAIKSFDERKEVDNIVNTLGMYHKDSYDGVWYIVVDSDKIPNISEHGGFRRMSNQKSFKDKLIQIHKSILSQTWKPTLVTAFGYDEFMKFLYEVDYERGCVTRVQTPNFWIWSNKFIQDSYVSVVA